MSKTYAFASQLAEVDLLSADDLLLVSKLCSDLGYRTVNIKYKTLSTQLMLDTDKKISSLVEDSLLTLSSDVNAMSSAVEELGVQESKCESAIVKIANRLQETMSTTQNLVTGMDNFQSAINMSVETVFSKLLTVDVDALTDSMTVIDGMYDHIDELSSKVDEVSNDLTFLEDDVYSKLSVISGVVAVSVNNINESTMLSLDALDSKINVSADALSTMLVLSTDALTGKMLTISGDAEFLSDVVGSPVDNQIVIAGGRQYVGYKGAWVELGDKAHREHIEAISASWSNVFQQVKTLSSDWSDTTTDTRFNISSVGWNSAYERLASQSAIWNSVYNSFNDVSASMHLRLNELASTSARWNIAAGTVVNLSGSVVNLSGSVVDLTETAVNLSGTVVNLSGNWNSVHDTVHDLSDLWNGSCVAKSSFDPSDVSSYPDGALVIVYDD